MLEELTSQLDLQNEVVFWGAKYGDEKIHLLHQSDVFVHPSHSEGFPTSVLEAAGLGLPCIVSYATNMGPFVEEWNTGVLLGENDPAHIEEAMLRLHQIRQGDNLKEMRARQIKSVSRYFDWYKIAQLATHLYIKPLPAQEEIEDQMPLKEEKISLMDGEGR